uniref:peptidylprolyl isomerase n=1 Tax=Nothoprocta perdicaria TaxID=30464 RepID=A0A8C6ZXW3_NOTPE
RGEPAVEVVHDHGGHEGLAQPRGQAHERVGQQRRARHAQLVAAHRVVGGVDPERAGGRAEPPPPRLGGRAATPAPPRTQGPPRYTKSVLKKGDKTNFPKKGDTVHCWYTGKLQDGTVFDTNVQTGSKKKKAAKPLSFKVGIGKVIRGWDEALLTMSKGEKAQLEIEPEWAYGKKGQPDAKIPPNAKLFFEVELVDIE